MFFFNVYKIQGFLPQNRGQAQKLAIQVITVDPAKTIKMTVLDDYSELGELPTIRYCPNDLYGWLERPHGGSRACFRACPLFGVTCVYI